METVTTVVDASIMQPKRSHPSAVSTCLIAEDNQPLRAALQDLLRSAGIRVVGATGDRAEAFRLLKRHSPTVMILDLRLGRASGLELARAAAEAGPGTALILYTSHADPATIRDAYAAGVRAVVLKQASPSRLLAAVLEVPSGSRDMDDTDP